MNHAIMHYMAWQVVIWIALIGWILFVAKLGEWKDNRERKKRSQ